MYHLLVPRIAGSQVAAIVFLAISAITLVKSILCRLMALSLLISVIYC